MPHVIFLNGPPRCGKDTVGQTIAQVAPQARLHKFAHRLKCATHALFLGLWGIKMDTTGECSMDDFYETRKGDPLTEFFGLTPRDAYIAVSELLCKPKLGQDFFGQLVVQHMKKNPSVPLWVLTDSGFRPEATPVMDYVGRENCILVRIHREGCSFKGDSRGYIDLPVTTKLDLENNGTLEDLKYLVRTAVLGKLG